MSSSSKCLVDIRFPAEPGRLKMLRRIVRQSTESAGCSRNQVNNIVLAVNEACMNIIQHAYQGKPNGEIILKIRKNGPYLEFWLKDYGCRVCPGKIKSRDLADIRPGGLGYHFMSVIMDQIDFMPLKGEVGNQLRMITRIQ